MADDTVGQPGDQNSGSPESGPRKLQRNEYLGENGEVHRRPYNKQSRTTARNRPAPRATQQPPGDGFGTNPDGVETTRAKARVPSPPPLEAKAPRKPATVPGVAIGLQHTFAMLSMALGAHWRLDAKSDEAKDFSTAIVDTQGIIPAPLVDAASKAASPLHLLYAALRVLVPRIMQTMVLRAAGTGQREAQAQAQSANRAGERAGFGGFRVTAPENGYAPPPPPPQQTAEAPVNSGLYIDPDTGQVGVRL